MTKRTLAIMVSVTFMLAAVFGGAALAADEKPAAKGEAKQDDKNLEAMLDELAKYDEKTAREASYSIKSRSKKNGKEETVRMLAFFKDIKNYVMKMEEESNNIKVVITPEDSWMYIKEHNMLMNVPADSKDQFDVEKQQKKRRGEAGEIVKSKDGEKDVYTITSRDKKKKSVVTCDPKQGVYLKVAEYDEKGELMTEAEFYDYKFGKIDEAEFKKPEGAQFVDMSGAGEKTPAAEDKKDGEEKKNDDKKTGDGGNREEKAPHNEEKGK